MATFGAILSFLIWLYLMVFVARALLSFVPLVNPQWQPRGAMLVFAEGVYTATDPPLRLVSRFVRPVRVGTVAIDLGFMLVFVGLSVLQRVVLAVFV